MERVDRPPRKRQRGYLVVPLELAPVHRAWRLRHGVAGLRCCGVARSPAPRYRRAAGAARIRERRDNR